MKMLHLLKEDDMKTLGFNIGQRRLLEGWKESNGASTSTPTHVPVPTPSPSSSFISLSSPVTDPLPPLPDMTLNTPVAGPSCQPPRRLNTGFKVNFKYFITC